MVVELLDGDGAGVGAGIGVGVGRLTVAEKNRTGILTDVLLFDSLTSLILLNGSAEIERIFCPCES